MTKHGCQMHPIENILNCCHNRKNFMDPTLHLHPPRNKWLCSNVIGINLQPQKIVWSFEEWYVTLTHIHTHTAPQDDCCVWSRLTLSNSHLASFVFRHKYIHVLDTINNTHVFPESVRGKAMVAYRRSIPAGSIHQHYFTTLLQAQFNALSGAWHQNWRKWWFGCPT